MGKLEGRAALITGGSSGIGLAVAQKLVDEGAAVTITGRNQDRLDSAVRALGDQALGVAGDAGDSNSAKRCVDAHLERYGRLDMLFNNAAIDSQSGPTIDMSIDEFNAIQAMNVAGPLMWTQLAWRAWMRENGGVVLNNASLGAFSLFPNMGAYNSSKAALVHLTRALAAELGPKVRVNAIAPGLIKTEMSRSAWSKIEEKFSARLPLERLGETDDVAKAALFLLGDDSSWITGETIVVDGGTIVQWGKAPRSGVNLKQDS